tara:strand:- start:1317 stop:2876 length:1560 start_codon:yes stop_codon:yes gene_type:complete
MAFRRYTASADNTIVSAYQQNLETRGTGANAGRADVVEVFSIYGRQATASQELSRYLVKFPITTVSAERTNGTIPASGSVSFYLKMYRAVTSKTVPVDYALQTIAVTTDWQEGIGLDLENYQDLVKGNLGSDWVQARKDTNWTSVGGDYMGESDSGGDFSYSQTFRTGLEDLEIDITPMVERWIGGTNNYGMLVKLAGNYEASASQGYVNQDANVIYNQTGATDSYYTKRFFARGTQFFYKRPTIEARWNSTTRDDRTNFFYSSSRATGADNLNTIYFYNIIRGRLRNLPGVSAGGDVLVSLYSGSSNNSAPSGSQLTIYAANSAIGSTVTEVTGGNVSTGIYSCSIAATAAATPLKTLYDVWWTGSAATYKEYFTGSILPLTFDTGMTNVLPTYYINLTNLKNTYTTSETVRLQLYAREKDWKPNIYTVANNSPDVTPINSASYRVYRLLDNYDAVPYGTGSQNHTGLSYDVSGNYFDFNMNVLEAGYAYAFKFAFYDEDIKSWQEQDAAFKFRVEED